jgi:hypothetical protein
MAKQLNETERAKADRMREFFDARKDGKIFTVRFIKRTTGEVRVMTCRREVAKYVKGVEPDRAETDKEIGCMTVYDMQVASKLAVEERSKAYRRIPLENVQAVRLDGEEWVE